ncbi:MAG: DUF4838 domain-containing protein, partial [Planctomycetota bacterium]
MPVIVGGRSGERTRAAAATLAGYLGRIGSASFTVATGDGASGIVVGRPGDFAKLPFGIELPGGPFNRERYVLRSSAAGVWLLGATELAVEHAVWDALYRLGHRQFFPGEVWEVVPRVNELVLALDADEKPDFHARRIWYNWGMRWGYNRRPYHEWCARNRAVRGFVLNSGHAYGGIVRANRAEFDAHPEYGALVGGKRKPSKFCVSNPGLRKLAAAHAVRWFGKNPAADSISMEPSDGAGWCECDGCARMGSVSDRALALANEAAVAMADLVPGEKYVGMYAYNVHSPPPSIRVHPRVIVSVATAFLRGGHTLEGIIDGWRAKGATLGIYDYFSVVAWDWNLPRRARAARPEPLAASIRKYHGRGARFFDAESGDAWGPYGLGYYVAGRVMWDVGEADRVDALVDDFLTKAFGPAREPMAEFYRLITKDAARRSSGDLVGRMYRHLARARTLAADEPAVRRRIDDLILYARYTELYGAFASAVGKARAPAKKQVLRHSYRMRKTMMVHTYGLWARLVGQAEAHKKDHPCKSDEPFAEEEIRGLLTSGIAGNKPVEMGFEPVEFSKDLGPAAKALALPKVAPGTFPPVPQDRQTYYIWVERAPARLHLKVTVKRVWNLRPHLVSLHSLEGDAADPVAKSDIVRPDGKQYDVILKTPREGLHRVEIRDGGDYTRIVWPEGMPVTLPSGAGTPGVKNHFRGRWSLYFYVPKGT